MSRHSGEKFSSRIDEGFGKAPEASLTTREGCGVLHFFGTPQAFSGETRGGRGAAEFKRDDPSVP
jgi:hypothetical protein